MNRHLIQLQRHSLPAITMLMIVSLMSPTGAVAAPSCAKNPTHPNCDSGGGGGGNSDGDSGASYKIAVYLGGDDMPAGMADDVDGSGNESRPKIGNTDMQLNLTEMTKAMAADADPNGYLCLSDYFFSTGTEITEAEGEFAVQTARRPKTSPDFTYIAASFWNFTVNGSVYFLVFGPDGNAKIDNQGNWPPDEPRSNTMYGETLELQVINGPAKKGPCDRLEITLDWEILVVIKE